MTCGYFRKAIIPEEVYKEILQGKEKEYGDCHLVEKLIRKKILRVKKVIHQTSLKRAHELNVKRGEGEALALYWQEKSKFLASDDDNVRKKANLLNIQLIGTPAVMVTLLRKGMIDREKFLQSVKELKKFGWFGNAVMDSLLSEAK